MRFWMASSLQVQCGPPKVSQTLHIASAPADPSIKPWEPTSLGAMFNRVSNSEADFIIYEQRRVSYREARERIDDLARALIAASIEKGDKVAVWMTNRPEWILLQFAIAKVGGVIVPLNTRYKLHEVEYILRESDAKMLFMMDRFRDIDYLEMLQALDRHDLPALQLVVIEGARSSKDAMPHAEFAGAAAGVSVARLEERESSVEPSDVAMILYTSGTTGLPKGAMLTHSNIGANGWYQGEIQGIGADDRFLVHVPLFHCFGCVNAVLAAVPHRASMVLVETFDPGASLEAAARERCTVVYGVPTMFIAMLQHHDFDRYDLTSLRTGIMSGAPCPVKVMEEVIARMGVLEITIAFGQTECSPAATMTRRSDPLELRINTVGCPIPGVECKVVDPKTGNTLPPGSQGEFCTRGHHVMLGYYKKPRETAQAVDSDGWLHTGDLVVMDGDGYFRTTGRMKDMYISGGFNVYPREVEEHILRHAKVKQVQVVGVPDELLGEVGMVWIELRDGVTASDSEIIGHCRDGLANFKVPKYIRFVADWPITATGKVQKYRLREQALGELGLAEVADQAHA